MGVSIVVSFIFLGVIYFLPSILAIRKWRYNSAAIIALNIFFGWTLVGWIVSLVWALTSGSEPLTINLVNNMNSAEPTMPSKFAERVFKEDERILSNDAFKLFLIENYGIRRNELLNKFVFHEKIYASLDDSLNAARDTYEKEIQVPDSKKKENKF